jgi:predicted NUDIX family phosphoesterase/thymidylate kinase
MDEITTEIQRLEELADALLTEKRSYRSRRPIVIEFCGTPKAGKSSCIGSLVIFLKRNGFKVKVLTERASICPINNKFDPNFNVWTGCSSLAELMVILSNDSKKFDVVIIDRGVFDAVCWFYWQRERNYLDEGTYDIFRDFFFAERWASRIDIVYILEADPKTALDREYANLLTRKSGSVMNRSVISSYNKSVHECKSLYAHRFRDVRSINTDSISQNEVSFQVTRDILQALGDLVSEKIGYVSRLDIPDNGHDDFLLSDTSLGNIELKYGRRNEVEADAQAVQPIPIAIIASLEMDRVLIVRKFNAATKKGSAERGRDLFYFGGHVRLEDSLGHSSSLDVFKATLTREIKEELGFDYVPDFSAPLCIIDRSKVPSANHMAVAVVCRVDFETAQFSGDEAEFRDSSLKVVHQSELAALKLRPERWSQVAIQRLLGWTFL